MKSNLHKLIGVFLAVCLVAAVMTMGVFATEDDDGSETLPPSSSVSPSASTEPETISVSFTITGYTNIKSVSVLVDGVSVDVTQTGSSFSFDAVEEASVKITVTANDGYAVTPSTGSGSGWTVNSDGSVSTSDLASGSVTCSS